VNFNINQKIKAMENPSVVTRQSSKTVMQEILRIPVLVAALGYMVDMYDLFLFSIVRVPSLKSLHLSDDSIMKDGLLLLNLQMAGLLVGGIVWGILGDKKGRLSVLFGSILIYSLANIGNGFVNSLQAYAVLRFIAGFGLAGELGAGITLVTEVLPNRIRAGVGKASKAKCPKVRRFCRDASLFFRAR